MLLFTDILQNGLFESMRSALVTDMVEINLDALTPLLETPAFRYYIEDIKWASHIWAKMMNDERPEMAILCSHIEVVHKISALVLALPATDRVWDKVLTEVYVRSASDKDLLRLILDSPDHAVLHPRCVELVRILDPAWPLKRAVAARDLDWIVANLQYHVENLDLVIPLLGDWNAAITIGSTCSNILTMNIWRRIIDAHGRDYFRADQMADQWQSIRVNAFQGRNASQRLLLYAMSALPGPEPTITIPVPKFIQRKDLVIDMFKKDADAAWPLHDYLQPTVNIQENLTIREWAAIVQHVLQTKIPLQEQKLCLLYIHNPSHRGAVLTLPLQKPRSLSALMGHLLEKHYDVLEGTFRKYAAFLNSCFCRERTVCHEMWKRLCKRLNIRLPIATKAPSAPVILDDKGDDGAK